MMRLIQGVDADADWPVDEKTVKRFWSKIDQGDPDECWEWTGAKRDRGYGAFYVGPGVPTGKSHRVAWELANGPIPEGDGYHGVCVCHRCDNPSCCNPGHLFLASQGDNLRDCAKKGRAPLAKLRVDQVKEMRAMLDSGVPELEVAAAFGVPRRNVNNIKRRRTWRGVEPDGQE